MAQIIVSPTQDPCDVLSALAQTGSDAFSLTEFEYLVTKVYLLAQIVKAASGTDFTDLCSLLESLKPCEDMPDYKLRAAELAALGQGLEQAGGTFDVNDLRAALAGCCCTATKQGLQGASALLLLLLSVVTFEQRG